MSINAKLFAREVIMQTPEHVHTYIVRRDDSRFSVVEIEDSKVDNYLHDLKEHNPQSTWKLEPRFPVCGAD